jgi:L-cystine uptake protein TcyP (sodium:dicarboxylate symporter family)
MISVVIFSAVILGLAGLAFQIAKRTTKATDQALHMARQTAAADKAITVPYDSITAMLTPDTVMSGLIRVVVRYTIDSISPVRKDIHIITTSSVPGARTDTITIQRGRVRYPIPLK